MSILGQDGVRVSSPPKRFGLLVVGAEVLINGFFEFANTVKVASADR
ncbi:MAG: hypothetical protein RIS79_2538, partial [Verrucomicrobiota bacterium]